MKKFKVIITEELRREEIIYANNRDEVLDIVYSDYREGDIVLDNGDFYGVDFDVYEEEDNE